MKTWKIYSEGYSATGEQGYAHLIGEAEGETFLDACRNWAAETDPEGVYYAEHNGVPSYWACGLFDNLEDARKLFG